MDNKLQNKNNAIVSSHINISGGFMKLGSVLALSTLLLLSACGGGADSESRPPPDDGEPPPFTGSLLSDDVKAFKNELWDKISPSAVCGRCHRSDADTGSRQAPYFVDWQDVNFAYDEVVERTPPLVDLVNPSNSRLVQRVADGHQCWLGSSSQCAAEMTRYIQNWADSSKKGVTEVEFTIDLPPRLDDPGDSKFFPVTAPPEYATDAPPYDSPLYALVKTYCSGCHSSTAPSAQSPFFADADIDTSYQAIKQVVNLNDPTDSRVYHRLVDDHNCWSTCFTAGATPAEDSGDAIVMRDAIIDFASNISVQSYDMINDAVSKALIMTEGTQAASYNRYESDQIALYKFKFDSDNPTLIKDTSNVEPAINLTLLDDDHRWLGNWGIEFSNNSRGASATVDDSRKLFNLIRLSGEYTVEAWVIPANVNQENTSIVSYSGDSDDRNFVLGQTMYNYDFYQRSSTTDGVGEPKLMTNPDDEDLQATLQHVVVTYSRATGRRIYVNGVFTGDEDPEEPGDLLNWHSSYALWFGNEADDGNAWNGILRMVAVHDRALNLEQIQQNYLAEVGQKYQVPFSVSHIIDDGVPHSYVVFEVSQFDEYSYLFRNPRFINIDPGTPDYTPPAMALRGMRIGVNNQIVSVGQAYNNISINDISDGYSPDTGKILSTVDTVLQIQNGPDSDEFFLTFDLFGSKTYTFTEVDQTVPPPLPGVAAADRPSDIGIRTFDEINASMASMTSIANWQDVTDINRVYTTYRQQFPAVENIETFLSSHQMAIAQLAMSYCSERVNRDAALAIGDPGRYFSNFDFTLIASAAFNSSTKVDQVVDPLLQKMLNVTDLASDGDPNLSTQPTVSAVRQEVNKLINLGETFAYPPTPDPDIPDNPNTPRIAMTAAACMTAPPADNCDNVERTQQIVKATCAAVLGSAAMLIQ